MYGARVIIHSTYVRTYREEEYVLVQYATYHRTKKKFRRIFVILRAVHFGGLNQGIFVF